MPELELKFVVPPSRQSAVARTMREAGATRTRLVAHYYDTADGCLSRHGVSLRLRKEGRSWVQTVKVPGDSRVCRLEHNAPMGRCSAKGPDIDVGRHDGTQAEQALRDALKHAAAGIDAQLLRRYSVDVQRLAFEIGQPRSVVEVSLDRGKIVAGDQVAPVCEMEYELKSGDPSVLARLAHGAVRDLGLWLSVISKPQRGERLLLSGTEVSVPAAVKARAPTLHRRMTGALVARVTVQACLDQILANASEVAAGSGNDEHIHQLRIGIRRLRTAMRELGALARGLDSAWEEPLVATFRALGAYRDTATVMEAVRPLLAAAGAPLLDNSQATQARADPAGIVRDPVFQSVLIDLIGFTFTEGEPDPEPPPDAVLAHVHDRLKKLRRQVVRDRRDFERLDESAQHRVRKRLKRLRYLAEFVSALFDCDNVDRFLNRLRPAQDALGEHNDTIVARQAYEHMARKGDPQAWFAVGWLKAHQAASAKACRKALRKVAAAPRFW